MANPWTTPPCTTTADGAPRRCGVELEFIGFDGISDVVRVVADTLGGSVDSHSNWQADVATDHGTFGVELDFGWLKRQGEKEADSADPDSLEARASAALTEVVDTVARTLVPWEVVAPPLPLDDLPRLDDLVGALREAGARGTRHSPAYAFGVHFNPELPALDADTIRRHLQAYMVLRDWLADADDVDLTRRMTPYIDDFDDDYALQICTADYRPDLSGLIDDYLAANATRNRSLDMLPLFAHLDEDRVRAAVDDPRVKARPTFHYRLPNCEVDDPQWRLARPWGDWCMVEALAADEDLLRDTCAAWCEDRERITARLDNRWLDHCRTLVAGLGAEPR